MGIRTASQRCRVLIGLVMKSACNMRTSVRRAGVDCQPYVCAKVNSVRQDTLQGTKTVLGIKGDDELAAHPLVSDKGPQVFGREAHTTPVVGNNRHLACRARIEAQEVRGAQGKRKTQGLAHGHKYSRRGVHGADGLPCGL